MIVPTGPYRHVLAGSDRNEDQFQVFLVQVTSVDHERVCLTARDLRNNMVYADIKNFPASSSSAESQSVDMPEENSVGLASYLSSRAGFMQVCILNWVPSNTINSLLGISSRPWNGMEGMTERTRGTYRKATPGQKTHSNSHGFTERIDAGWDRTSADFTRDKVNPLTHTWNQLTGRFVRYTDSGISVSGPVERPNSGNPTTLLPDGTRDATLFLNPTASLSDRYVKGVSDVIPLAETREMIQEFSLDFPIPLELLNTALLDQILGTTADPWARTTITTTGNVAHDDQSWSIDQDPDHPTDATKKPVGPTTQDGATPRRRAFIMEKTQGTLVGYNLFDTTTYGKVLKPTLFPYTSAGRFATDVSSGYLPVNASVDHVETRLAASAYALRFPHEYNTTRFDFTKEGFTSFELGATIPKEKIGFGGGYEHPHGAGRSLEGHTVGSVKLVFGKNRDEEEALDLTTLGQTVLRLGADDSSLPNERREVLTQQRGMSDALTDRSLQFWSSPKLLPGDAGSLENKTGAENVSLRGALDGGTVVRFGARNPAAKRRHLMNGYQDGQGKVAWGVADAARKDSHTSGRPTYGAGDASYAFHDLTQAGSPIVGNIPYNWSGTPVTSMDAHGLSIDFHTVRDILLRVGANEASGQSLLLDLAGGLVAWLGKDSKGRSVTATLDGGVEVVIGQNSQGKGMRLEINGDVDISTKGHVQWNITGDLILSSNNFVHNVKGNHIITGQKIIQSALVRHTIEAPDVVENEMLYSSDEDGGINA